VGERTSPLHVARIGRAAVSAAALWRVAGVDAVGNAGQRHRGWGGVLPPATKRNAGQRRPWRRGGVLPPATKHNAGGTARRRWHGSSIARRWRQGGRTPGSPVRCAAGQGGACVVVSHNAFHIAMACGRRRGPHRGLRHNADYAAIPCLASLQKPSRKEHDAIASLSLTVLQCRFASAKRGICYESDARSA
jgi:hypothetical protein